MKITKTLICSVCATFAMLIWLVSDFHENAKSVKAAESPIRQEIRYPSSPQKKSQFEHSEASYSINNTASKISPMTAKANSLNKHPIPPKATTDKNTLATRFNAIFKNYDADNLSHETCKSIRSETEYFVQHAPELTELGLRYCQYCDALLSYEKLNNAELEKLVELDDLAATHVLARRKLTNEASLSSAVELFHMTMVRGSISGALDLENFYYEKSQSDPNLSGAQKRHYSSLSEYYRAFITFREEQVDFSQFSAPEARVLEVFIEELKAQRMALGLGKFPTVNLPTWPEEFGYECAVLRLEQQKLTAL